MPIGTVWEHAMNMIKETKYESQIGYLQDYSLVYSKFGNNMSQQQ